jgi:hypothetical protein
LNQWFRSFDFSVRGKIELYRCNNFLPTSIVFNPFGALHIKEWGSSITIPPPHPPRLAKPRNRLGNVIVTRPKNKICHDSIEVITNKISALKKIPRLPVVLQINPEQAVVAVIFFVVIGAKHFTPGNPVIFMPRPSAASIPIRLRHVIYLFSLPTKNLRDKISVRTAND